MLFVKRKALFPCLSEKERHAPLITCKSSNGSQPPLMGRQTHALRGVQEGRRAALFFMHTVTCPSYTATDPP